MPGPDSTDKKRPEPAPGSGGPGCLRLMLAAPFLLLAAPLVSMMRSLARRRRGQAVRLGKVKETAEEKHIIFSSVVDFPSGTENCRRLTGALAALAATLSGPRDRHYLLYDDGEEGVLLGIGPSVQELAERFMIMCRKHSVENRNLLWLGMEDSEYIGSYFSSGRWETDGPESLAALPLNWALEIRRQRGAVSTRWDLRLRLPQREEERGRSFFSRLLEH